MQRKSRARTIIFVCAPVNRGKIRSPMPRKTRLGARLLLRQVADDGQFEHQSLVGLHQ